MGYNFELEKGHGQVVILIPFDDVDDRTYPIELRDVAKMIELLIMPIDQQFSEDDLIDALRLWDKNKEENLDSDSGIAKIDRKGCPKNE